MVLRIRIFKSHTHQDPVHLQIFYKGMLDYLAQETVDQMLPRLNDLLQINGEKTTFFYLPRFSTDKRLQLILGLSFISGVCLVEMESFLDMMEVKEFRH